MRLDWIKGLPMAGLLLSVAFTLSSCNTIAGAIGGLGRDISAIGGILGDVSGSNCGRNRCGKRRRSNPYLITDH